MFRLGDFAFDRMQYGIAQDMDDAILYGLFQLKNGEISISAESEDLKDKDGNLIRRKWMAKTGTMTATNAMLNVNILASQSGNPLKKNITDMPTIVTAAAGSTITVATGLTAGDIHVCAVYGNGATEPEYAVNADGTKSTTATYRAGSAASSTEYVYNETTGSLQLPKAPEITASSTDAEKAAAADFPPKFLVAYRAPAETGLRIANTADKFPETIQLTIRALYIDPCKKGYVKPAYIYVPSFKPSPECTISTATDTELEYTGDLQTDYCGDDKALYYIYFPDEDIKESDVG